MYTILHAILGYVFLILTVRILSRRPGGQMTPSEFVLVFLIGGVIILATMSDDRSLTNGVCAVITVCLLHRLVASLKIRFPRLGVLIDGTPLVLLENGKWNKEIMRNMRLEEDDVMATARTKGCRDLSGIKYAILERQGAISIIQNKK